MSDSSACGHDQTTQYSSKASPCRVWYRPVVEGRLYEHLIKQAIGKD